MNLSRSVTTVVDAGRCTGCGLCVRVCPSETLRLEGGRAVVAGSESLGCDHCAAVCPEAAVQVTALDPSLAVFDTFTADPRWLPPGRTDLPRLARLMASRRSCRNYTDRPVRREQLTDLVKIGVTAPSGSNCQPWTFTLLPTRADVEHLARSVAGFYERINRQAARAWLRWLLRLAGRPQLDFYYRNYHAAAVEKLDDFRRTGRDWLFHGAPAAIVVASRPASCPTEDCLLAAGQILLAAHAMGLGTCLVGFAVEALGHDRRLAARHGLPADETARAVIAIGHPAEVYRRTTRRKPVTVRDAPA